jgi:hypothetical protein
MRNEYLNRLEFCRFSLSASGTLPNSNFHCELVYPWAVEHHINSKGWLGVLMHLSDLCLQIDRNNNLLKIKIFIQQAIPTQHRWFSGKISRCHLFQINSASPGFDSRPMQHAFFLLVPWYGRSGDAGLWWRSGYGTGECAALATNCRCTALHNG